MNKLKPDSYSLDCDGRQRGFTLIELMIALGIGLFVIATVGVLFINSRQTYLAQDASSRIIESARYASEFLGRQGRSSGYLAIKFQQLAAGNLFAAPVSYSFSGTPLAGTEGASSASDTVTFSFDSSKDCLGQAAPSSRATNLIRINASKQLECLGNGSATPGVILDDVEDMQILYGQPAAAGKFSYLAANTATMAAVTSLRICLLLRAKADTDKRAIDAGKSQTYTDCLGTATTKSDGYLRRAVTTTVDLRNRLP